MVKAAGGSKTASVRPCCVPMGGYRLPEINCSWQRVLHQGRLGNGLRFYKWGVWPRAGAMNRFSQAWM